MSCSVVEAHLILIYLLWMKLHRGIYLMLYTSTNVIIKMTFQFNVQQEQVNKVTN